MRRLIVGCCLLLEACSEPAPPWAVDGDTIEYKGERVRLWGIDAPELGQTCLSAELRRYNCGMSARNALTFILQNRAIVCHTRTRDQHDRRVVQCNWIGGAGDDIGQLMVRQGWAVDYKRYSGGYYAKDEQAARSWKLGIHEGPFVLPEEYRLRHRQ